MTFAIIKHKGDPNKALTHQGIEVTRQEAIYVDQMQAMIPCARYDTHFVYVNPDNSHGQPAHLCTCGGMAQIRNRKLFVCMIHEQYGEHTTSFINKKDIDKLSGRVIHIDENNNKVTVKDRK